jgi:hypothetical protein
LQDFNFGDIETHCRTRLNGTRAVLYARTIASRAEGVFLWAYMVTEDLRTAVNQGDTEEDLELRLEECPGGMNELFTFLLERQDKFYAKYPKPYLHLLDVATKKDKYVTVLELFIASEDQEKVTSRFPVKLDDNDDKYLAALNSSAVDLEANVVARCAGLVECTHLPPFKEPPETYPYKNLSRMRDMRVTFIHRSVQDFLAEGEEGIALLQSCSISEQNASKRWMTAMALLFLTNSNDTNVDRPLSFASCLHEESWTAFETSIADELFSAQHHRKPSLEHHLPYSGAYDVTCPQLSPVENLAFYLATYFGLTAYLAAKLTDYEPTKSSLVAGISMCHHINSQQLIYEPCAELIDVLQPHLCYARTLTLQHKFSMDGIVDSCYVAARPLWQHLYLALATAFFSHDRHRRREASSIYDSILSSCKGEELDLECRIILTLGNWMTRIVPAPDADNNDDDGALLNRTDNWVRGSFKIRMAVHGFRELNGSSVDFLQYSPAGLNRFFDIEAPSTKKSLRKTFDRIPAQRPFTEDDDPAATNCIAAILNDHLDDMSSSEVAKVVYFEDDRNDRVYRREGLQNASLCFIVSKGQIHGTSRREWKEWEKRLKAGIFDDHFETDPEHDPILCEILTSLRPKWAEQAEREAELKAKRQAEWEAKCQAKSEAEREAEREAEIVRISATSSVRSDEDTVSSIQNGRTGNDN